MSYEVGSQYRSTLAVTDADGAPVDPATEILTITLPDQTLATPAPVHDGVGQYHVDYAFIQEGLHKFVWSTTTPATCRTDYANANTWRSAIGFQEAKDFINDSDADKDPILRQIMSAALEVAEGIVGICVPRKYTNERVTGNGPVIRVPHAPLLNDTAVESIVSVWPNGPSWTTNHLIVYPDSGTVEASSYYLPLYYGPWKVTYTAGRAIIPESIQLAVKEIIFDMWSIMRPYGSEDLEPGPDDTSKFEQLVGMYSIPPHAKVLLGQFEQPGFA